MNRPAITGGTNSPARKENTKRQPPLQGREEQGSGAASHFVLRPCIPDSQSANRPNTHVTRKHFASLRVSPRLSASFRFTPPSTLRLAASGRRANQNSKSKNPLLVSLRRSQSFRTSHFGLRISNFAPVSPIPNRQTVRMPTPRENISPLSASLRLSPPPFASPPSALQSLCPCDIHRDKCPCSRSADCQSTASRPLARIAAPAREADAPTHACVAGRNDQVHAPFFPRSSLFSLRSA